MVPGFIHRDRLPELIPDSDEGREFELVVEFLAGTKAGWGAGCGRGELSVGTGDGGAGRENGRGPPVVANWDMEVIWLKGIGCAAEEGAYLENKS